LILKSPGHTARIKLLLELFPEAKFVHIHRHPHAVFQSSLHLQEKATPFWALQKHRPSVERVIEDYTEVYDAYFEQRPLIPAKNFCDISYDQLEQDPIATIEQVYSQLRLPEFDDVRAKLQQYVESLSGYSKNRFPELANDIRERLAREWVRCFDAWQYTK
jgi:LPS sulfotransferase NodH